MRRALTANTGLAVLLWFFAAPFFHLHAADTESLHHLREVGHDQDAIVHFHMPGRHSAGHGVAVSSPDEDEKPLDSFALVPSQTVVRPLPFLLSARIEAPQRAPDFTQRLAAPRAPRGHDPPDLLATKPRAPPV
jgi:hypothetical protein